MDNLIGDWDGLEALLERAPQNLKAEVRKATDTSGRDLESTIVGHFEAQDLGWAPLAESTLRRARASSARNVARISRSETLNRLGSMGIAHSPRERTRELKNRLVAGGKKILIDTGSLMNSIRYQRERWYQGFVGVNRNANQINVAAAHEYGTSKMPARPYIKPSVEEKLKSIQKRYQRAVDRAFE